MSSVAGQASDGWWQSRLSPFVRGFDPSGYAAVRDEMAAARAAGVDILPLKGSTIQALAPHVLEAVVAGAHTNMHGHARGLPELRAAISRKLSARNGIVADPEREILVTGGSKHALHMLLMTLLEPGDEVVFPTPAYTYWGSVRLAHGKPVAVLMREADGYRWDPEAIEAAVTPRTRVLLLCAPMIPTGYVPTAEDLLAMGEIAERHDLVIVMDEAHENLVFDGRRHVSAASLGALRERTVTLFSMTKAHNLTGYRIGYLVGNAALIDQVAKMVEWSVLLNPYLPQLAAKAVLEGPQDWLEDMIRLAERNRNVVSAVLDELEGVSHVRPAGGMYHFINVRGTGLTDLELYRRLLREHGIPTEPGWISGEAGHLRLTALGSPEAVVDELAHRLRIAWQKL